MNNWITDFKNSLKLIYLNTSLHEYDMQQKLVARIIKKFCRLLVWNLAAAQTPWGSAGLVFNNILSVESSSRHTVYVHTKQGVPHQSCRLLILWSMHWHYDVIRIAVKGKVIIILCTHEGKEYHEQQVSFEKYKTLIKATSLNNYNNYRSM